MCVVMRRISLRRNGSHKRKKVVGMCKCEKKVGLEFVKKIKKYIFEYPLGRKPRGQEGIFAIGPIL